MKSLFGGIIAVALVATLSGCVGAPTPTPTTSNASPSVFPPPSPSSSPSPTAAPLTAPTVRFDLGCDDFYPTATLKSLFSESVVAQTPAQAAAVGERAGISHITRAQQNGGIFCSWSNGKPVVDSTGHSADGQAASVTVYPNATARWNQEARYYGLTSNTQQYCSDGPATCYLNALKNGYLVHTEIQHIRLAIPESGSDGLSKAPPAVKKVFAAILAKLAQAGTPRPAWQPATPAASSPKKCESYITGKQVQTALHVTVPVVLGGPDGGAPFAEDVSIFGCTFLTRGTDAGYGQIRWLHEGSAALSKAIDERTTPALTPVNLKGLQPGDSATIGRSGKQLYIDLSIGGNWIELRFFGPQSSVPKPKVADSVYAKAIARDVIANLGR